VNDSSSIVAVIASLATLLTAAGGVWVAVRNAGRQGAVADVRELKAHRQAWLWAVRTIHRLRAFIADQDLEEPSEWKIDEAQEIHEKRIAGEPEETKK
jgi:hypothetical protein